MREKLKDLLMECIADYADQSGEDLDIREDSRLLGSHAMLDSLGLVTLIAAFEAEINDELDLDILLADERAMSMKRSPFRTPAALIDYAVMLVEEEQSG